MKFKVDQHHEVTVVEFELPEEGIKPADLRGIVFPWVDPKKGVILSGRGPIWLYGYLIHHYHPTAWVATHDPRLGCVVIEVHVSTNIKVGDVIPLPSPIL